MLIWADWCILAIVGISALLSVFRGFVREFLSLVAWAAAGWLAMRYAATLSVVLETSVPVPSARILITGAAIFVVVLFGTGVLNYFIGLFIKSTGLSATDRALGMLFGIARGLAIVLVLVFAAGATPIPADPWWRQSLLLGHFEKLAIHSLQFLPPLVAAYIRFPSQSEPATSPPVALPPLQPSEP